MLLFLFSSTPLKFFVENIWRDEAFSYLLAKRSIGEIFVLTAKDYNPPLYYIFLHYWTQIFGSTEIALRSLSFIFFWATLYVVFLFLKNIFKFSQKKSMVYLLLFLINPLLSYYAFEARMYSMLAFFAVVSFYALCMKKNRLYLIVSVIGLYTHYFFIFILACQIVIEYIKHHYHIKKIKPMIVAFGLFVPWILFFITQHNVAGDIFWIEQMPLRYLLYLFGLIYTGYEKDFFPYPYLINLSLLLLCIVIYGIFRKITTKKTDSSFFISLFLWGIGIPVFVYLISFIKPIFLPRYLIFSSIGFILFIIFVVEQIPSKLKYVIIGVLLIFTLHYQVFQINNRKRNTSEKALQDLKALVQKKDYIYVTNELDFLRMEYYFGEKKVFIYGKTYDEIPSYIGKVLIPKEKLATRLPSYPLKAFVINPDASTYTIQSGW
jgi:uncharacterized membrane protein